MKIKDINNNTSGKPVIEVHTDFENVDSIEETIKKLSYSIIAALRPVQFLRSFHYEAMKEILVKQQEVLDVGLEAVIMLQMLKGSLVGTAIDAQSTKLLMDMYFLKEDGFNKLAQELCELRSCEH